MVCSQEVGNFIPKNSVLAKIYSSDESVINLVKISEFFVIHTSQVSLEDYRFSISKLVDISLRALSPGINDPKTAIISIRKIGVLLSLMADKNSYAFLKVDEKLSVEVSLFKDDIYDIYAHILTYVKADILVVLELISSLKAPFKTANSKNKKAILEIVDYIVSKLNFDNELDKRKISNAILFFKS